MSCKVSIFSTANPSTITLLAKKGNEWKFDLSIAHLVEHGIDPIGYTVTETIQIPGLEGVIAPDDRVLGEVVGIQEDLLAIIKTNQGEILRPAQELSIERRFNQIGKVLERLQGTERTEQVFNSVREVAKSKSNFWKIN